MGVYFFKLMILKDFKKWVNSLSEDELQQTLIYNSDELCISGVVQKIVKAKENLYLLDENDILSTKKDLLNMGYEKDEIEELTIEIHKGSFYILI